MKIKILLIFPDCFIVLVLEVKIFIVKKKNPKVRLKFFYNQTCMKQWCKIIKTKKIDRVTFIEEISKQD